MSAVLILMTDRNELIMDVSGAWVRTVSPMLATSRLFSPEHPGNLSHKIDAEASRDSDKDQIGVPLSWIG